MPQKNGAEQPDTSGSMSKSQRTKMIKPSDDNEKRYQSHKWTVYVRGATNEDLGVVVKRAVFQLHSSFNNPTRVVDSPPFEVSESGWGEFEIAITLHFHNDVGDKPLHLYHHLKLYPEEESGPLSTKKPVVVESYDEIVLSEPSESFFARVQNHPAVIVPRLPSGYTLPPGVVCFIIHLVIKGFLLFTVLQDLIPCVLLHCLTDVISICVLTVPIEDLDNRNKGDTKDHPLTQWFTNFSEADELLKLAAARQQVQAHIARLRRQLSLIDGQHQQLKAASDM
ncbi:hypothetical protein DH2020_029578 [Rehmannia glutinosa]|uniref:YEATS domain-containing protein n=1 Tax=Rehmannia glutinosa TaxID=99300 RepID=A0ABR0VN62_REHGL